MRINFYVESLDISKVTSYFDDIIKIYKLASKTAGQKHRKLEVNVTFLTDEEIHIINREKRGVDKPTDVLSFPMLEVAGKKVNKKNFPTDYNEQSKTFFIGDVLISLDRAKLQAEEFGHSEMREVCFLAVHGLLHLLGYDHEKEVDEKLMRATEEFVLTKSGFKR